MSQTTNTYHNASGMLTAAVGAPAIANVSHQFPAGSPTSKAPTEYRYYQCFYKSIKEIECRPFSESSSAPFLNKDSVTFKVPTYVPKQFDALAIKVNLWGMQSVTLNN